MKIPLHGMSHQGDGQPEGKISESEIMACKRGDWEAKHRMAHTFTPLLHSLAKKRINGNDPGKFNELVEAGKKGLFKACRKYPASLGATKFQIYALDFIESAMDSAGAGVLAWFKRLLGG